MHRRTSSQNILLALAKIKTQTARLLSYHASALIGLALYCVSRQCEMSGTTVATLKTVVTPGIDAHHLSFVEFTETGVLVSNTAHLVLNCLYLASHGMQAILWTVKYLASEVTQWTSAWANTTLHIHTVHPAHARRGSRKHSWQYRGCVQIGSVRRFELCR